MSARCVVCSRIALCHDCLRDCTCTIGHALTDGPFKPYPSLTQYSGAMGLQRPMMKASANVAHSVTSNIVRQQGLPHPALVILPEGFSPMAQKTNQRLADAQDVLNARLHATHNVHNVLRNMLLLGMHRSASELHAEECHRQQPVPESSGHQRRCDHQLLHGTLVQTHGCLL